MKTSLMEATDKTRDMLQLQKEPGPINNTILLESEALVQMIDSLFMEWFIKKQERVQLYDQMVFDNMNEESIWYTSDSIKCVFVV